MTSDPRDYSASELLAQHCKRFAAVNINLYAFVESALFAKAVRTFIHGSALLKYPAS